MKMFVLMNNLNNLTFKKTVKIPTYCFHFQMNIHLCQPPMCKKIAFLIRPLMLDDGPPSPSASKFSHAHQMESMHESFYIQSVSIQTHHTRYVFVHKSKSAGQRIYCNLAVQQKICWCLGPLSFFLRAKAGRPAVLHKQPGF